MKKLIILMFIFLMFVSAVYGDCVEPEDGMVITEDTTFCEGEYYVPEGIEINESNLFLNCQNATLLGHSISFDEIMEEELIIGTPPFDQNLTYGDGDLSFLKGESVFYNGQWYDFEEKIFIEKDFFQAETGEHNEDYEIEVYLETDNDYELSYKWLLDNVLINEQLELEFLGRDLSIIGIESMNRIIIVYENETYNVDDGDSLKQFGYGDDPDEAEWIWDISSEDSYLYSIGIRYNFDRNEIDDIDEWELPSLSLGNTLDFPNNYTQIEFSELYSEDYEQLNVEIDDDIHWRNEEGELIFDNELGIIFEADYDILMWDENEYEKIIIAQNMHTVGLEDSDGERINVSFNASGLSIYDGNEEKFIYFYNNGGNITNVSFQDIGGATEYNGGYEGDLIWNIDWIEDDYAEADDLILGENYVGRRDDDFMTDYGVKIESPENTLDQGYGELKLEYPSEAITWDLKIFASFIDEGYSDGIFMNAEENVIIQNCNLFDYYNGLNILDSQFLDISNNNILDAALHPLKLEDTSDSIIYNNVFLSEHTGTEFYGDSIDNSIFENNFINQFGFSIKFNDDSSDNLIYNNNMLSETGAYQAILIYNDWFYNEKGNYWLNYTGEDNNGDGIGDTSYFFNGGQDNYPFMEENGWVSNGTLPDLVISNVNVYPAGQGHYTQISITIKNEGDVVANGIEYFSNFYSNESDGSKLSLEPGETQTINLYNEYIESGNHTFTFVVDPEDKIEELNEDNNEYLTIIYVEPLPDLSFYDDWENWDENIDIEIDDLSVFITAEVFNLGEVEVNGFDYSIDYEDGYQELKYYDGTLLPNQSIFLNFSHNYSEYGEYRIEFRLDPFDEIYEIENGNNNENEWIELSPVQFNITSLNFYLDGELLNYSDNFLYLTDYFDEGDFEIEIEIQNILDQEIDWAEAQIHIEIDDWGEWEYDYINNLDPLEFGVFNFDFSIPSFNESYGEMEIRVQSESEEYDWYEKELNYDIFLDGSVPGNGTLPDLVIYDVDIDPACPGEETEVEITIKNEGDVVANGIEYMFDFDFNETIIASKLSLEPGETERFYFEYEYMESGNHTFIFVVDPENKIVELNENNNEYMTLIYVDFLPDLSFEDEEGEENATIEINNLSVFITAEVFNLGEVEVNGFDYSIDYEDGYQELKYYDGTLLPNQSIFLNFSHNYSEYDYYDIEIELDQYDEIDEIEEWNNDMDFDIDFSLAHFNITILNFYLDGELLNYSDNFINLTDYLYGDSFEIEIEIQNILNQTLDGAYSQIYIEVEDWDWHGWDFINDLEPNEKGIFTFDSSIPSFNESYGEMYIRIDCLFEVEVEPDEIVYSGGEGTELYFDLFLNGTLPEEAIPWDFNEDWWVPEGYWKGTGYYDEENLAQGKLAIANSNSYEAYEAVDGDYNSRWSSNWGDAGPDIYFPHGMIVDLENMVDIENIIINLYGEDPWEQDEQTFFVSVSPDMENWTLVFNETEETGIFEITDLPSGSMYRYVGFSSTYAEDGRARVYEIEVYGEFQEEVIQLNPEYGYVGDEVEVEGINFTQGDSLLYHILFDGDIMESFIYDGSGSFEETFEVPEVEFGNYSVAIIASIGPEIANTNFEVLELVPIIQLDPEEGYVGDEVEIKGYNFTGNIDLEIYFGDSNILNVTTSSFGSFEETFEVPEVEPGNYSVVVEGYNISVNFEVYKIPEPEFILKPDEGYVDEEIIVNGYNFPEDEDRYRIIFQTDDEIPPVLTFDYDGSGRFEDVFIVPHLSPETYFVVVMDSNDEILMKNRFEILSSKGKNDKINKKSLI